MLEPGHIDRSDHIKDSMSCLSDIINGHNKNYPERWIMDKDIKELRYTLIMLTFAYPFLLANKRKA